MTVQNPCFVLQGASHPADGFRRVVKALRSQAGVDNTGDLAVTQNGTPNMSVNVAAGQGVVDGSENATLQGSYEITNDATVNLAIAASDPTNPRNDLIVLKVQDSNYSGGTLAPSLAVVTGTPAGSPSDPATPVNAIVLARVRVDATVTSILNAKITDLRTWLDGAIFPGAAGFTIWDSTSAFKQASTDDNGLWLFRNALKVPPSKDGTVAPNSYGTLAVKLDEQTTASGASVTLTVPSGGLYRALIIRASGRSDQASAQALLAQFNGDTAGNYDYQFFNDLNVTITATAPSVAQTTGRCGALVPTGATAGRIGQSVIDIDNADSSSQSKNWEYRATRWDTDAAASANHENGQGQWRNTANAITSILLKPSAGNLVNFRAVLYGLP